jgi:hypothetical protein
MCRGLGFPVESEFGPVPAIAGQPALCATVRHVAEVQLRRYRERGKLVPDLWLFRI